MKLHIVVLTHPGKCRQSNEDSVAVGSAIFGGLMPMPISQIHELNQSITLMVADGMGGHQFGEVASRWLLEYLNGALNLTGLTKELVAEKMQAANRGLFDQMHENPQLTGMGSTLVGLYCEYGRALLFNVGDSRAYRLQDGFLAQLSIDDTYDRSSFGESSDQFKTGRISQAMGGAAQFIEIVPHLTEMKMMLGDTFLLCSDGLTDMLSLDDMEALFSHDMETTASQLFTAAMNAGGIDNISILLARVE